MNKIKTVLENSIGTWLTIPDNTIAELLCQCNFEWIVIDLEHSSTSLNQAADLIRTIDLSGKIPLVRLGNHDPNLCKRVLDAGAMGIIFSTVEDSMQARSCVNAVKYPPLGKRGVGLSRAQGYGQKFQEYYENNNKRVIIIAQIETKLGVDNSQEILSTDGIDGFFIGPYDLSCSLGKPGNFECDEMQNSIKQVMDNCEKLKKMSGIHVVSTEHGDYLKAKSQGYKVVAFGIDFLFLRNLAFQETTYIESKYEKNK